MLIGLSFMWGIVYFFYWRDNLPQKIFLKKNIFLWSVLFFIFFKSIAVYRLPLYIAALVSAYFIASAMMDYCSGYVYLLFSYLILLGLILSYDFNYLEMFLFVVYLKILEKIGVYGGGDTIYIFLEYLLNSILDKNATEKTILVLFMALFFHTVQYWRKKGKMPFTPHLCIAEIVLLNLKGVLY